MQGLKDRKISFEYLSHIGYFHFGMSTALPHYERELFTQSMVDADPKWTFQYFKDAVSNCSENFWRYNLAKDTKAQFLLEQNNICIKDSSAG